MTSFPAIIFSLLLFLVVEFSSADADVSSMPYMSTPDSSPSDPYYYYQVTVESYASRVQYLSEYDLGKDGTFEIALNLLLTIAFSRADAGRTMIHLLACEEEAAAAFLNLPTPETGLSSVHIPPYCAMTNRSLAYYCQSFPLEDQSDDAFIYQSSKVVTGSVAGAAATEFALASQNSSGSTSSPGNRILFFIDSCETLGGQQGILRSCLEEPPSSKLLTTTRGSKGGPSCFFCPNNYPLSYSTQIDAISDSEGCLIPPSLPPTLRGTVAMNLCNSSGECLGKTTDAQTIFYGLFSLAWAVVSFFWIAHIRAAARDAVVELQNKMKLIPLSQTCYSLFAFLDLYTQDKLEGTSRGLVQNMAVLSQLVALAVFAEVVVLIAKGWKITRPALLARELQWVRFVTLGWAASFAVLQHSDSRQVAVVVVWGVSWACVVFMVWYNSAFNLNMLKYQLAMVRQLDVDPRLTPVYIKFMLFRRFRGLLGAYIFFSCLFGIAGVVNDATQNSSKWSSLQADEALTLLLFISLGYTFRCRRFSRLIRNSTITSITVSQAAAHRGSILPEPTTPVEEPAESPKRIKTIVVLNPDHAPCLATATAPPEQAVEPVTVPKSSNTS